MDDISMSWKHEVEGDFFFLLKNGFANLFQS